MLLYKYRRFLKLKVRVLVEQMLHGYMQWFFEFGYPGIVLGRKNYPGNKLSSTHGSAILCVVIRLRLVWSLYCSVVQHSFFHKFSSGFWAPVCKTVYSMLPDHCLSVLSCLYVLSVCDTGVLWPNGWMDQDATWYGGRPHPRPHCFKWWPSSPPPGRKGHSAQFLTHVCCGQMAGWIKMPLGRELGHGPGIIVLDGDPQKRRHSSPHFLADIYCGQMAGWIKMPLGVEVGLTQATLC